jgi:hypothetical protein
MSKKYRFCKKIINPKLFVSVQFNSQDPLFFYINGFYFVIKLHFRFPKCDTLGKLFFEQKKGLASWA